MIFSKKYKYRSIIKKKTNKFFFFFHFFAFLFKSDFFLLIFQKKSNLLEFNIERKEFVKKGFILKKTSSTYLRHLFKKYKPFFKGFINLAFDFHFICYPDKKKEISKAKEVIDMFKKKEMNEKYEILLLFYKGRFYTNFITEKIIFNYTNIAFHKKQIIYLCQNKLVFFIKKIYLFYFSKKLVLKIKNVKI